MPAHVSSRVVVLNGGSSSGTSTLARALQELLPGIWLTFGVDTFIDALPGRGDSPRSGIGYDAGGAVLLSDGFTRLEDAWYSGLSAMARSGADLILDEALLSGATGQQRLRSAFGAKALTWVGVHCDPEVAAAREAARGDRIPGMARQQASRVHLGVAYDLEVDTTSRSPQNVARSVADFLEEQRAGVYGRGPSH
ncbi:chloramphenicol phosphotransferase CPT family protein [Herbiconiux sp. CPCC 203407]|uniref:Chloramphenicol phosphotransferase CPT family protein n=1 Tax=Herbiconiux oxytropis TaxID=2970915 RepID=A0AA41XGU3_9MICO|nr:chloramphenicol phosphotransferase CPT family protein [Herbiconiux oxytropis]MCS5723409.1 chloramphenicol phosphotransferase CPT family protein [Herbiconiux oxytropis]MCS5727944.1 chloramphenicol phosphotransferase CPT family protein [Herbiconiux oxytropis]